MVFIATANWWVQFISFEAERDFAEPYVRFFSDTDDFSDEDYLVQEWLQGIAEKVVEQEDLPDDFEVEVHYVRSPEVNAFATLGGHVYILSGLVAGLPDENSLAMVVAHEVAHIKNRDALTSVSRGIAIQLILSGLAEVRSSPETFAGYGSEAVLFAYSREQEQAADIDAAHALAASYGGAHGITTFFELTKPEDENSDEYLEWLQSHPDHEDRLAYLYQLIQDEGWDAGEPLSYPEFVGDALNWLDDLEEEPKETAPSETEDAAGPAAEELIVKL